jgi:hypothetical protein
MEKYFWDMNEDEAKEFISQHGVDHWERKVGSERALAEQETGILPNPWNEESFNDERQQMITGHAPEWAEILLRAAEEDETRGERTV